MKSLILASGSNIRAKLLHNAMVSFDVSPPNVDEVTHKESLIAGGFRPRDIADALADAKARKISGRFPDSLVLGCDQILEFRGGLLSKPKGPEHAILQLQELCGDCHTLFSAAVIYEEGKPVWRHVGQVRVHMRNASQAYLSGYIDRNWASIQNSVGGYNLEEEGARLITKIEGDHFNVLGMPLLEVLSYLTMRGTLAS